MISENTQISCHQMTATLTAQQLKEEQQVFDQEVNQVKTWWKKDRFKLVTRPYTAEEGVCV